MLTAPGPPKLIASHPDLLGDTDSLSSCEAICFPKRKQVGFEVQSSFDLES